MVKDLARKIFTVGRSGERWQVFTREVSDRVYLPYLRWRLRAASQGGSRLQRCGGYTVRINDAPNFYVLSKDIFMKRIYHFEAQRADPVVLDCGSNIGMSILYFKHVYPKARVVGFEPDPTIFPLLQENIRRNSLADVGLVQAAVTTHTGTALFQSDGKYGSCLGEYLEGDLSKGWEEYEVPCVRLWDYLTEPVDFLKMNVEGAEFSVLADSADRLRMIREMVIEYHHLPRLPRTLHKILALLHEQGFEYLVNDFDIETNGRAVSPPFRLEPQTRYFLLIYARRLE